MRLTAATAKNLQQDVMRPAYDRDAQGEGIVHFGIGAFHRAHQAVFTDSAMSGGDRDWAITGVSLRSGEVAAQLNPQDGLFTVGSRSDEASETRLVGSVRRVLVAAQRPLLVVDAVSSPEARIVSLTITEKGYCRAANGTLDHSLAADRSVYAFLAAGFERRRAAGLPGLTILSCDNLASNGQLVGRLFAEYLDRHVPMLRAWFETECTSPSAMVDRIVPATTPDDRLHIESALGVRDEGAIVTEPFSQWVIEDRFAGARPRWENVGVQFARDIHAYETAKLRMLNGAHSALAYLGLRRGYEFVHESMRDPELEILVHRLMRQEAAPSVRAMPELDLERYADQLIRRFNNSMLPHRLVQIAMDGSQKISQRWLETLEFHRREGRSCPAILEAVAAWVLHVRGDARDVDDPKSAALAALWRTAGRAHIVPALFGSDGLFSSVWIATEPDVEAIEKALGEG